jgi:hypothetical protein
MSKITYVAHTRASYIVEVRPGHTVLERREERRARDRCGLLGAYATRHVFVDEAWREKTGPRTEPRRCFWSSPKAPGANSGLACQMPVTAALDGLIVRMPGAQQRPGRQPLCQRAAPCNKARIMDHTHLFDFENDFVSTLRCIPMAVRFKLDRVGIKLTLRQWSRFTTGDRRDLLHTPCQHEDEVAAYGRRLIELAMLRAGEEVKPLATPLDESWREAEATPRSVRTFAGLRGLRPPSDLEWQELHALQRYVLTKLTRDNHDNVNFGPAMAEFGVGGYRPGSRPKAGRAPSGE